MGKKKAIHFLGKVLLLPFFSEFSAIRKKTPPHHFFQIKGVYIHHKQNKKDPKEEKEKK